MHNRQEPPVLQAQVASPSWLGWQTHTPCLPQLAGWLAGWVCHGALLPKTEPLVAKILVAILFSYTLVNFKLL